MAPAPTVWAVAGDTLWCLGLGCLLAALRDGTRLLLGEGALRCFARDIAAFAAAAVLVCGFAAGVSAGGLARWYMAAAMLLGALCWHWAVQPAVHRVVGAVLAAAAAPLHLAYRRLLDPARQRRQAYRAQRKARRKAKKSNKTEKTAEKQLQKPSNIYYN